MKVSFKLSIEFLKENDKNVVEVESVFNSGDYTPLSFTVTLNGTEFPKSISKLNNLYAGLGHFIDLVKESHDFIQEGRKDVIDTLIFLTELMESAFTKRKEVVSVSSNYKLHLI